MFGEGVARCAAPFCQLARARWGGGSRGTGGWGSCRRTMISALTRVDAEIKW